MKTQRVKKTTQKVRFSKQSINNGIVVFKDGMFQTSSPEIAKALENSINNQANRLDGITLPTQQKGMRIKIKIIPEESKVKSIAIHGVSKGRKIVRENETVEFRPTKLGWKGVKISNV